MKQSFWVNKNNKPQLIEGELMPESEDDWCPGELRLHEIDGNNHYVYISWFNTPEEVIEHEIESAEFGIQFEKEMLEAEVKNLEEEKEYWVKLLETYKKD